MLPLGAEKAVPLSLLDCLTGRCDYRLPHTQLWSSPWRSGQRGALRPLALPPAHDLRSRLVQYGGTGEGHTSVGTPLASAQSRILVTCAMSLVSAVVFLLVVFFWGQPSKYKLTTRKTLFHGTAIANRVSRCDLSRLQSDGRQLARERGSTVSR